MDVVQPILIAMSLCADCFAVSLCSSVTVGEIRRSTMLATALSFAIIQSVLLLAGWLFGNVLAGFVSGVSHVIGFLLLLYVGGSMLAEGISGHTQPRDLNGLVNVLVGGVATSIDALAVGVSQSVQGIGWNGFLPLFVSVFVITAVSVLAGISGGRRIGFRFGRLAEIIGGCVLVCIGAGVLLQ